METIQLKRSFINDMAYMFIPLEHEIKNEENGKSKLKLKTDNSKVVLIPNGETIESCIYLKNKLGVVIELVD